MPKVGPECSLHRRQEIEPGVETPDHAVRGSGIGGTQCGSVNPKR
jgi:hypothetical protein